MGCDIFADGMSSEAIIKTTAPSFILPSGEIIDTSNLGIVPREESLSFAIAQEKSNLPVASCAYVLITRTSNGQVEVLLAKPRGQDYWALVGGKVEQGENPWAAAIREVCEEAHLDIEDYIEDRPRATFPTMHYAHPERGHQTTHIFIAHVSEGSAEPQPRIKGHQTEISKETELSPELEMAEFKWFTLEDAEAMCATDHPVMRDVRFALQFARERHNLHNYFPRIVPIRTLN